MFCFPISFSCFHGNSDAEARSTQTQPPQICRPVGPTDSLCICLSPCVPLSLRGPLLYFPGVLFTGWRRCHQRRLDPPPELVHLTLSPLFSSYYKPALYCFFVMACIIFFFVELTPRWSELCRCKQFYTQVT